MQAICLFTTFYNISFATNLFVKHIYLNLLNSCLQRYKRRVSFHYWRNYFRARFSACKKSVLYYDVVSKPVIKSVIATGKVVSEAAFTKCSFLCVLCTKYKLLVHSKFLTNYGNVLHYLLDPE